MLPNFGNEPFMFSYVILTLYILLIDKHNSGILIQTKLTHFHIGSDMQTDRGFPVCSPVCTINLEAYASPS